jgi:hypothetical protein
MPRRICKRQQRGSRNGIGMQRDARESCRRSHYARDRSDWSSRKSRRRAHGPAAMHCPRPGDDSERFFLSPSTATRNRSKGAPPSEKQFERGPVQSKRKSSLKNCTSRKKSQRRQAGSEDPSLPIGLAFGFLNLHWILPDDRGDDSTERSHLSLG